MISMMLLVAVAAYILFARFVVRLVYKTTGSLKKKRIAIAIFLLIPTWDVILGYPVYWYLCHFKAGVKIYRTVDNVEGIYVGRNDYVLLRRDMIPRRDGSPGLYSRYQFVDMYDERAKKYYRLYPVKTHADPNCMDPGEYKYGTYAAYYNTGRCIARKEIPEEQVSRWGYLHYPLKHPVRLFKFPHVIMDKPFKAIDRESGAIMAEATNYSWLPGWLMTFLTSIESGPHWIRCMQVADPKFYTLQYVIFKPQDK
ncbi:hypothetical protein G3N55_12020 [Dissulfurirhabdus thermomarina]|uniref:Uncharacterized protein n=1 Tax=Dissulfurirhabdus thermomarina TaxID=1765737 RepID=A0A6N9TQK9_DISTH|nr:hypothetical protein [Dissulfurirhabdus thermomarina]NDY43561.1 hypothetical protein [Dissulfurirhabdus thermomarina]